MRLLLAQLAPVRRDVERNLARLEEIVRAAPSDLAIFPELFLSGYRIGDGFHALAVHEGDRTTEVLRRTARDSGTSIVVGTPMASAERPGEVRNAALAVLPSGAFGVQVKRYLPNFGPFEEGLAFTPTETSRPIAIAGHSVGLEICYDAFFPEVSRDLSAAGAELIVNISAAPVTSRHLFERLFPARAIENACPCVYVNRVGVEDGMVFGGGTGAWDPRGEPLPLTEVTVPGLSPKEAVVSLDFDLGAVARWRPFRPVLRDAAARGRTLSAPGD
jgi:(R)-amidase